MSCGGNGMHNGPETKRPSLSLSSSHLTFESLLGWKHTVVAFYVLFEIPTQPHKGDIIYAHFQDEQTELLEVQQLGEGSSWTRRAQACWLRSPGSFCYPKALLWDPKKHCACRCGRDVSGESEKQGWRKKQDPSSTRLWRPNSDIPQEWGKLHRDSMGEGRISKALMVSGVGNEIHSVV